MKADSALRGMLGSGGCWSQSGMVSYFLVPLETDRKVSLNDPAKKYLDLDHGPKTCMILS